MTTAILIAIPKLPKLSKWGLMILNIWWFSYTHSWHATFLVGLAFTLLEVDGHLDAARRHKMIHVYNLGLLIFTFIFFVRSPYSLGMPKERVLISRTSS